MAERRVDLVSLVVGLLALLIGGLALLDRSPDIDVDGPVVAASVLLVLGVLGVTRTGVALVRRSRRSRA